jgi:predicted metal-dependent hydrolase
MHIIIRPKGVEVVIPYGTPLYMVDNFIEKKKQRVLAAYQKLKEKVKQAKKRKPERYVDGARLQFLGTMVPLAVEADGVKKAAVLYDNGFLVRVPSSITGTRREQTVKKALKAWLKEYMLREIERITKKYGKKLGLYPAGIRIKEQKRIWGSCGKTNILNFNLRLSEFPPKILAYVAVHELCHIKHRDYSKKYWALVSSIMPEWREYRRLLKSYIIAAD